MFVVRKSQMSQVQLMSKWAKLTTPLVGNEIHCYFQSLEIVNVDMLWFSLTPKKKINRL